MIIMSKVINEEEEEIEVLWWEIDKLDPLLLRAVMLANSSWYDRDYKSNPVPYQIKPLFQDELSQGRDTIPP